MILTLTLNPSVDISYSVSSLALDDVNRVKDVSKTAGGKGLNVTRVLAQLQEPVLATGFIGGQLGQFIAEKLDHRHIQHNFYTIAGETRNCIAVLHDHQQTEILEQGPTINAQEASGFIKHLKSLLEDIKIVAISGSLPQGLSQDFYAEVIRLCRERQIPVVLDCSGQALLSVLQSDDKPTVIKPNISELSQLLSQSLTQDIDTLKQALSNSLFDGIEWIVVSLGADGAFAKHGEIYYKVNIPNIEILNAVGSGDSTVAGITSALLHHSSDEALLRKANTLGMLNAQEAQTGYVNLNHYDQLFNQIEVLEV